MVFTEHLLAKAVCTRSIRVLGWQPDAPKAREYDFPTKPRDFLKLIGPVTALWVVALKNQAYGRYGTLTSQSSVYNVN